MIGAVMTIAGILRLAIVLWTVFSLYECTTRVEIVTADPSLSDTARDIAAGTVAIIWFIFWSVPAVILGVLASAFRREPAKEPPRVGRKTKTCPMCAETVKAAAVVCRFCGHDFSGAATAIAPNRVLTAERDGVLRVPPHRRIQGSRATGRWDDQQDIMH
jgi:Uncharacterised protein family UPF0547